MPGVTVSIPVFGQWNPVRLTLTLEAWRAQVYGPIELILSEQGSRPRANQLAKKFNARHIFHEARAGDPIAPGAVRNRAVQVATHVQLYLTDGDILPMNPEYLMRLCEDVRTNSRLVWVRPPMKRLIEGQLGTFAGRATTFGIRTALDELTFPDGYTTAELGVFTTMAYRGKPFTVEPALKARYERSDPALVDHEYSFLHFTQHPGGIFVSRQQFDTVSGYSEIYRGWGYEDTDLKWKLRHYFDVRVLPEQAEYTVLHLDHPKRFRREEYERNRELFESRREKGAETAIQDDIGHNRKQ